MGVSENAVHQLGLAAEKLAEEKKVSTRLLKELREALTMIDHGLMTEAREYAIKLTVDGHYENQEIVKLKRQVSREQLNDDEIHAACPYVNYEGGKIWFQAAKWYQEEMCKLRSR
jgi:hypothetical protein